MLGILKAKRESFKKAQEEESNTAEPSACGGTALPGEVATAGEPIKPRKKKLPPTPEYITKFHLENFKKELLSSMPTPGERVVEKPVEKIVEKPVERIVERPVERVVEREKIVHLTGNALLDKIFFGK